MNSEQLFTLALGLNSPWEVQKVEFVEEPDQSKELHVYPNARKAILPSARNCRGFAPPRAAQTLSKRHVAGLELIATVALTVSLVVAATAVSIGDRSLARGDVIGPPSLHGPQARD